MSVVAARAGIPPEEAQQRVAARRQAEELVRQRRELQRSVVEREAQLHLLEDALAADRAELKRIEVREQNRMADAEADQSALAAWRWADPTPTGE